MLLPWIKGLRSPTASAMLAKAAIIVLALATLYHLQSFSPPPYASNAEPDSQSMSLSDGGTQADIPSNGTQDTQDVGEESKLEINDATPVDTNPSPILVNSSEPPTPSPSHEAAAKPSIANDLPAFDYNRTFLSYGPKTCYPSFNTTMQHRAFTRHASCENSAPFPINETLRVAFATASTGSALSPAYKLAINSQMTHSTIHNNSMHMLCADLVPGIWNKIAFLINLVTNELLKPQSERLDWIMWMDRDTLILDQCRPLSSFLPPKTDDFKAANLIASHDTFGLNAGVFFFRPNEWVLDFFYAVLAYPLYNPYDDLVFAEQSAMARLLSSSAGEEKYSQHFARVPWYWFNAYPPDGANTTQSFNDTMPDDYEWFRPRKGDFLAHFAGHPGREKEMRQWAKALEQVGDVWQDSVGEVRRDVTSDVRNYWRAWRAGTLTDGMRGGEPVDEAD